MDAPNDLITTTEAIKLLGISTHKMRDLIAEGDLKVYVTKLHKRKKLVSKADVEALKIPRAEAA